MPEWNTIGKPGGNGVSGRDDRGGDRIQVIAATGGRNGRAPYGNVTNHTNLNLIAIYAFAALTGL